MASLWWMTGSGMRPHMLPALPFSQGKLTITSPLSQYRRTQMLIHKFTVICISCHADSSPLWNYLLSTSCTKYREKESCLFSFSSYGHWTSQFTFGTNSPISIRRKLGKNLITKSLSTSKFQYSFSSEKYSYFNFCLFSSSWEYTLLTIK